MCCVHLQLGDSIERMIRHVANLHTKNNDVMYKMLLADRWIDGFHVTENRKGDQTPSRIKVRIDTTEKNIYGY